MINKQNFDEEKYSFWDLIQKFRIEMPVIQRDYVQGRKDQEATQIRQKLIKDIKKAIDGEKKIEFDFIYGSVNEKMELSLLDGQQRITTLFLLYWYFAKKEGKLNEETKNILKKFSYKNRISSREFINNLIDCEIEINKEKSISELIKNKTWFFSGWIKDPTIENMLNMLDEINLKLYNEKAFDQLTSDQCPIKFYFIELKRFNLTDELYIKMNSRGKKLTKFEILKSKIIEILKKYGYLDLKEEFERKIDSAWTDLFWDYKDEKNLIDDVFVRYIYYITEMIYEIRIDTRTRDDQKQESPFVYNDKEFILDLNLVEKTYKNKENVELLINILNIWKSKEEIDKDFSKVFSSKYEKGKICLFNDKINLFESCINGENFGIAEKIILFAFLIRRMKETQISEDTIDYIRVVRNILQSIRYFDNTKVSYMPNIRYVEIKDYFDVFSKLDNKRNIYENLKNLEVEKRQNIIKNEKEKAKLIVKNKEKYKDIIFRCEDIKATRGILTNFIDLIKEYPNEMEQFISIFEDEENIINIYRAMLSINDYGIDVGKRQYRYFYGDGNDLYNIMTFDNDKDTIKSTLNELFNKYEKEEGTLKEKIENIMQKNLSNYEKTDWQYYLIKYKLIWQRKEIDKEGNITNYLPDNKNILIFNDSFDGKNSLKICTLTKTTFKSRHISPYYKAIFNQYNLIFNDCYSTEDDYGRIALKNGIYIEINENGFIVEMIDSKKDIASQILREKYNCKELENNKLLVNFKDELDFIEQEKEMVEAVIYI